MINKHINKLESKHYYLLLVIIIIFVILQSFFLLNKFSNEGDEWTWLIYASGNYDRFNKIFTLEKYPYGEFVDVKEYEEYFKVKKNFSFDTIKRDVGYYDCHPPLYTWILHIWIILMGGQATLITGLLLNLFIGMFVIILFFKLALEIFDCLEDAMFSVILFSFLPALYICNTVRSYFLLMLIVIAFIYYLLPFVKLQKNINLLNIISFSLFICLGLLCHYEFVYICLAVTIFLFIDFLKEGRPLIFHFVTSCIIGFLIFCNIFPEFTNNFNIQYYKVLEQSIELKSLLDLEVYDTIWSIFRGSFSDHSKRLIDFLVNDIQSMFYIFITIVAIFYLLIWFSIKRNRLFRLVFHLSFYQLLIMSLVFISKKTFFRPLSLNPKYYLFLFPFLCLSIIFFIRIRFPTIKKYILVCLCQIVFFSTVSNLIEKTVDHKIMFYEKTFLHQYIQNLQDTYNKRINIIIDRGSSNLDPYFNVVKILPVGTRVTIISMQSLFSNIFKYLEKDSFLLFVTNDDIRDNKIFSDILFMLKKDDSVRIRQHFLLKNIGFFLFNK